ncbi:hypothetical protein SAMN03159473_00330 [Pseudomonas sp. NFACC52]|nr:hypothetical protein SAMN03159481_00331 [Pseudomonas sp. NFACC56-3]SFK12985.1 hypothetical protein SAMN03159473_00330 [Pseudomonas sp. NFACC52]
MSQGSLVAGGHLWRIVLNRFRFFHSLRVNPCAESSAFPYS